MTFLAVATFFAQCANLLLINVHQRVVYPLVIAVYTGYLLIEAWLAYRDPADQWSMALFIFIDVWAIATAIQGWRMKRGAGWKI